MKVVTNCTNCKAPITIKGRFNDRGEIRREMGESFTVQCPACLLTQRKAAEDYRAVEYKHGRLIVFLLTFSAALLIFLLIYYYLFAALNVVASVKSLSVAMIPATVYSLYVRQELGNIKRFNDYY